MAHYRSPKFEMKDENDVSFFNENWTINSYPKSKLANVMFTK